MMRRLLAAVLALAAAAAAACPAPVAPLQGAALAAAQREARDHGFLWRITRDGRSSYLFGTLHLGRPQWMAPGPALRRALAATDTLALELDPGDPATMMDFARAATAPHAEPAPELAQRLAQQWELACLPGAAMAALHPVLQASTLSALAGREDGLDPAFAQETMLAERARALRRPVVALESVAEQLQALLPLDEHEGTLMLDEMLQELEQGRARPLLRRLVDVWDQGRLDELEHYADWCDCANTDEERALMQRLNDGRNPHLAERIEALHAQGKRVLAGVGALHMTGPQGLPRLLAARGFRVERLSPAR